MKHVARRGVRAGPDRDRQKHDVGGRKAGDRQRHEQPVRLPRAAEVGEVAKVDRRRRIAAASERVDEEGRRGIGLGGDGHPAQRQVHPGIDDAVQRLQCALDGADAGTAADAGNRQHVGEGPVLGAASGTAEFLDPRIGRQRHLGRCGSGGEA